uniref:Uncharacterized protein n=1 Tax=Panagrolaimus sp. ES5 TaxID=591445 RepID=A0AC34G806_9BILA
MDDNFCDKTTSEKAETPQELILKLRKGERIMLTTQAYIEKNIQQNAVEARAKVKANVHDALAALERKLILEKRLKRCDGIIQTLEFERQLLENAKTDAEVLQAMDTAVKALKLVNIDPDPNDLEILVRTPADDDVSVSNMEEYTVNQEELLSELRELQK